MAKKDKNRHSFWKRLHFKYRLSILNENTLEEIWKLRVSMFNGIVLYLVSFLGLLLIASILIITTPIRNYLPGYLDSEIREKAIKASMQVDSLELQMYYQSAYLQNIKDIFEGKVQSASESKVDTVRISTGDKSLQSSDREKKFRAQFEEEEKYNLSTISSTMTTPTEGVTFFRPVKGVIAEKFNATTRHYGVKLVTAGESVVATLEGAVFYTGYDTEAGHIIQIQHKNGFVSVYKGVSMLLKKTGDKVRTGEAVGMLSTAESKDNVRRKSFRFELWYKGNPVNPEIYISF